MKRYLEDQIKADLDRKMVFLGGPRQVGKTTVAKAVSGNNSGYLNWDIPSHRQLILKRKLPEKDLWIFDELHKYRRWRNYLKGIFDEFHPQRKILVTGSARLDLYRFGGDSLQGRYYYIRLHPFTFKELGGHGASDLDSLFNLGGFPEPFLGGSQARARRWSVEYRNRLIREDISSLESIRDIGTMESLMLSLPDRVGSPLSLNSLREDLQISHQTVSRWVEILERTYAIFRLLPFGQPLLRAVKKEQKHYHFDWSVVPESGARFENLIASHLLKWIHFQFDTEGREIELKYFRDVDGREVDFVLVEKKKPIMFVEAEISQQEISPSLQYIVQRFPEVPAYQVHFKEKQEYVRPGGIHLWSAKRFLETLV